MKIMGCGKCGYFLDGDSKFENKRCYYCFIKVLENCCNASLSKSDG